MQMALGMNKITGVPAGSVMSASGLPYAPTNFDTGYCVGKWGNQVSIMTDSSKNAIYNICLLQGNQSWGAMTTILCAYTN